MKLIRNANIFTMDPENEHAEAMAIENGIIRDVGTDEDIKKYMTADAEVIDMKGRTILPGFNDSHVHFFKGGQASLNVDLSGARSHADVIRISKAFMEKNSAPEGEWLIGRGWDENYLLEKEPPLRAVLDQISTSRPIVFSRSCEHAIATNSKAIELAGIHKGTPQPDGGEWCKRPDGSPNGLFKDMARDLIFDLIEEPDKDEIKKTLQASVRIALENGITSVQTDDFWSISSKDYKKMIEAYTELEKEGELKVRVYEQCVLETPEALESFIKDGFKTGHGSAFFKIGPFKTFVDGGIGVRSAYLYAPYSDDGSTSGSLTFPEETLEKMMTFAAENGMQLTAHAIGDKASEVCLDAFKKARQNEGDKRPSIIHAHLLTPELLQRYPADDVIMIGDSIALVDDMPMFNGRLGAERERYGYNFRTFLDNGGKLALATDWPVSPISPFKNLYTATTRKNYEGFPEGGWIPEEKITLKEALYAYTRGSAYCSREEDQKGTLAPGKLADFIVVSEDIFKIKPEELLTVKVLETYVGGTLCFVYS